MQPEFPDGYGSNQGMHNSEVYVSNVEANQQLGSLIHTIQIRVTETGTILLEPSTNICHQLDFNELRVIMESITKWWT
jgi:hypothetical protein